ncbi:MAG: FliA/WhiG family RNA polymerase sigma factor [bacterium]|nr:FliA/WhiG family RNA polymerase sigma factor [bacterium]
MSEEEKSKLWLDYSKQKSAALREQIIIEYASLVKIVAGRLSMYLGYTVEYDDLIGYGTFGLIDAIDKFDYQKGVKFETYASLRIRGAILDQIRRLDWIPRTLRQKQKKLEQACHKLECEHGKNVSSELLANELEISMNELEVWKNQTMGMNLISLDEYLEQGIEVRMDNKASSHFDQPEKVVEKQELKGMLEQALETLTENERKVIVLYYYEEMTLKEISYILEVSESRVSQLHTKSLQKMKSRLGSNIELLSIF